MALIADDPQDRAEQLLLLSERLMTLCEEETRRIQAREPPIDGALADEKNRLANAYRLELARIKQDPALIAAAPPALLSKLKQDTLRLQHALDAHEIALGAVKLVAEGLVQAMAEEVARQRGGGQTYGATGGVSRPSGPIPVTLDRSA